MVSEQDASVDDAAVETAVKTEAKSEVPEPEAAVEKEDESSPEPVETAEIKSEPADDTEGCLPGACSRGRW